MRASLRDSLPLAAWAASRRRERVPREPAVGEGLAKHLTKAFEAMALLLLRQMPVAAVARHVGETDKRLW
jgi:transposase